MKRPWYGDWRVWVSMALLAACGILEWLVGIPLRILDALWIFN